MESLLDQSEMFGKNWSTLFMKQAIMLQEFTFNGNQVTLYK